MTASEFTKRAPDKRIQARMEALRREIDRTAFVARLESLIIEAEGLATEMGLSWRERDGATRSLREWRDRELAREPYIPGVVVMRPPSEEEARADGD